MKKNFGIVCALVLACAVAFAGCSAGDEDAGGEEMLIISGVVTDVAEDNGVVQATVDAQGNDSAQQILVANLSSDVKFVTADGEERTFAAGDVAVGDTVEVYATESTPMTASEPPALTPVRFVVTGTAPADGKNAADPTQVSGVITGIADEDGLLALTVSKTAESDPQTDTIVYVDDATVLANAEGSPIEQTELAVGMNVDVTTDGTSTRSIPPQTTAETLTVVSGETIMGNEDQLETVSGTVTEIGEEGGVQQITVSKGDESDPQTDVIINMDDETVIETEDGTSVAPEELAPGMAVNVTTNGIATRSIPPQMTALTITIVNE